MNEPPWMQVPEPLTPRRVISCCCVVPGLIVVTWLPIVWFVRWLVEVTP